MNLIDVYFRPIADLQQLNSEAPSGVPFAGLD